MSALSFTQSQHVIRGNNRIPLLLYHRIICLQIKHTLHTRGRRSRTICQALCHFIILPNPLPQPPSPPSVTTVGCVQRTALHKCVIIRTNHPFTCTQRLIPGPHYLWTHFVCGATNLGHILLWRGTDSVPEGS